MLSTRLTNAHVVTMDPAHPVAHDIGIWRGRIVGLDEAVTGLPAREVVDLQGATVLPGFIDSHVHLAWTGLKAATPSVAPCERVEDVLAVVARAVADKPVGAWVDIVGYDQRALGRHLTAVELDKVADGRKVFMLHDSGHGCVVNSAVLDLLPASAAAGGGFLAESAMTAARRLRLPYSQAELADAIERAGRQCLGEGITACAEAGIGGGLLGHSPVEAGAYQALRDRGRLPLRVQLMAAGDTLRPVAAHADDGFPRALDLGLRTGFGDDWLSVGALKIYTDGGMMARTAALTGPYVGTDGIGELQDSPEAITELIVDGHLAGWQLAVHAIGDRAADLALDALERAQALRPRPDARHRIEHAGLIRPDQLPRFAALGLSAVFQPWLTLTAKVAFALENLLTTDLLPGLPLTGILRASLEEVAREEPLAWGASHRLAPLRALPSGGPFGDTFGEGGEGPGLGGDHDCVLATSSTPGVTDLSSRGPSARYVWDLSDRDRSLWVVPLGATGVPADAHHRDQLPRWLRGELVPVLTDFAGLVHERTSAPQALPAAEAVRSR
ncbi:amidohydrolase family protein [Streptomyces sp. NPDC001553]|uniref:amidohydrolase family protein n=1 Tax=Streptomyces sp. NPDC001553 TaxID=3154385 RepID=UPI00331DCC0C